MLQRYYEETTVTAEYVWKLFGQPGPAEEKAQALEQLMIQLFQGNLVIKSCRQTIDQHRCEHHCQECQHQQAEQVATQRGHRIRVTRKEVEAAEATEDPSPEYDYDDHPPAYSRWSDSKKRRIRKQRTNAKYREENEKKKQEVTRRRWRVRT